MKPNRFQHIDLRVSDLEAAWSFYTKFLPVLGFTKEWIGKRYRGYDVPGELPKAPFFSITEEKDHRPNHNRIAVWAESREEVDRLGHLIREIGGQNISGPRACPEYSRTYYAVFFEDPSGNCLEVCYRTD